MHPDAQPKPARIDFSHVAQIGTGVVLTTPVATLPNQRLETWMREHLIGRIPGAGRADV